MEAQNTEPEKKPSKAYGKRSKKQWIVIYVVVAVIAYALIYFLFMRKSGGTSGSGGLGY